MRILALLALALVAGCVTPRADEPGVAPDATTLLPWTLEQCRYVVGRSEADAATVQARMPEGFLVQSSAPLGLPVPVGRTIIGTEAFDCAAGTGLDARLEPMLYGSIWIPVTPPEALADAAYTEVYYKIDVLVPDAPRRERLEGLGLPVGDGDINWETSALPGGLAASETIEGAGDFRFEMVAERGTVDGEGRPFMEITPARDGYAVWRANFTWDGPFAQGTGFIDWPADHWVVAAIGMARAPATFHAGTWSFEGNLTLPAR